MPKLWNETIEAHRSAVREATLDTAAALVAEHGLLSVTMTDREDRIGRATPYGFSDVEAILLAWHERLTLRRHRPNREQAGDSEQRLKALKACPHLPSSTAPRWQAAAFLHRYEHLAQAQRHSANDQAC
jgi:hypothetical protein